MMAVRFDCYGDVDVLDIRDVPRPSIEPGHVIVQVKAVGINPGEASIRKGLLHDRWPATFPSGQGSDFAETVIEIGEGVRSVVFGDEVLGFTNDRASQAEYVMVPAEQVTAKPAGVSWDVAGSLFVAGSTAFAAVRAIGVSQGETVAVAGAAGGVGAIAVQLAKRAGATVLGIAGNANDEWLSAHEVVPVNHGDNLAARLAEAAPLGMIDAFLDFFGGGYVELAVDTLGIEPGRVNSVIDFSAVERFRTRSAASADAADAQALAELAGLVDAGKLDVPIAKAYRFDEVRQAYRDLEERHTRGKIVLRF